ncbi:transketolase [Leeia sp.]|uniref:transketolase n=1 Tax=Leeia sp. TaxID=2884678 RepID=UPI0035ADE024
MNTLTLTFNSSHLRKTVLEMAYAGSTVHIGCAFSIIELLAVLYRNHLRYPGNDPEASDRDYLILSKGHGVMAQYACMRELGWLPEQAFSSYFANGSGLKGLSDSRIRGLEVTSGSLGHGFSVGVGMALGAKIRGTDQKTYALVGDGELNEGPIWEGMLFASHHRLKNLMVIVDENGFQAMGKTADVLELGSIQAKFESFGFIARTIDGHNEAEIDQAINELWASPSDQPKALIAKTVKGKGVPFMEHDNIWHYTRLTPETYSRAMAAVAEGTD